MGAAFFIVFAIVIAIIIAIRVLAKKDSTLGKICLWYWNTSFKFAAHIPFLGWMAHFIITDGSDEAESMREHYINVGQQSDNLGAQMAEMMASSRGDGFASRYVGGPDGGEYELHSTNNHQAILRDFSGNLINVMTHGSEGNLIDRDGNLYYPD